MITKATLVRLVVALATAAILSPSATAELGWPPLPPPPPGPPSWLTKLEPVLQHQAYLLTGSTRVVVRAVNAGSLNAIGTLIQLAGGTLGRPLSIINGRAATIPNSLLPGLASSPLVQHISVDRFVLGANQRTSATVGATAVRNALGFDGSGVGVAVIDSGITSWHDDLTDPATGNQRVAQFVDFVNGAQAPYDDYGHGSHVAGIIAGNGFDSSGGRAGIAPNANLVVLKALDANGNGRISDVIAALDYVVNNKDAFNIRVVNMSMASGVSESYNDDPLTLAAKQAVTAGIVVVAAAGNAGRDSNENTQ
jgi:serine protease AprX